MSLCPIALWKQQRPEALAFSTLTYKEFDRLIQCLCTSLSKIPEAILAFSPQATPLSLALFFAAWRMGKTVYPLSFRLPKQAIKARLKLTNATWIDLDQLTLSTPLEVEKIDLELRATLIETSSASKVACHLFKSHLISAKNASEALRITINTRYCLNLPLFHISGISLMLRTFLSGATLLFPDDRERATHISMVPTQLLHLLKREHSFPHLQCLLIGGAPTSPTLCAQALQANLPLYLTYGMTEAGSIVALKPPHQATFILPHIEIKLSDEHEILLRGPSLLHCYWGQEVHADTSWFSTRDLGRINSKGELEIIGRKDRQFISGGENIHPEEIEEALLQLPNVIEARVEPQEDLEFGMRPTALLYCDKMPCIQAIQRELEKVLPRFKIPKNVQLSTEPLQRTKLAQMDQDLLGNRD